MTKALLASALFLATIFLGISPAGATAATPGGVYVLTNAAAGNAVAAFLRAPDGALTPAGTVATGGLGTGGGLGSQGALALSPDGRWLFAVNAGSNDISVLRVVSGVPSLVAQVAAGGAMPISLTLHKDLLYVLNAGSSSITGFRVGADGSLAPLAGSTRPLSGTNVGPAQVSFAPDGRALVVTEKATNLIDTYKVGPDGLPGAPIVQPSAGVTPFGFAFAGRDHLIVSDAFGGASNGSAASSYTIAGDGSLTVVDAVAWTHQTAACWLAATNNGRYAYTANAGSGTISGYAVDPDGHLSLLSPDGVSGVVGAGSHPIDLGVSQNDRYLYALANTAGVIAAFEIGPDGSLTAMPGATGLPASVAGLAAR